MGAEQSKEWKQEITKQDLPYQVVGKYFGAKSDGEAYKIWQKTVKENKNRLAKMAGVNSYTGTAEQNIKIAERLRKNDVESFYDYKGNAKNIQDFDKMHDMIVSKNLADEKTLQYYIANLDEKQITTLNTLSTTQRALFIAEECKNIENIQGSIKVKVEAGGNIENKNLAAMKELMEMQERIEAFIEKYLEKTPVLVRFKRVKDKDRQYAEFEDKSTEKEFQIFLNEQKTTEEYKKIVTEKGETVAEEQYRQLFIVKNIDMDSLSDEAKREFANIVIDIYDQAKEFGIDLVKMGCDMMYTEAIKIYQSTDMYAQLSQKVMSDDDINTYFDKPENKVEKIIHDDKKNVAYYKNLVKLYPAADIVMADRKHISEYLEYLNDDLTIKDSAPEKMKKNFDQKKEEFLKQTKIYETKMINRSNAIIQEAAIEQCLTALQKTMDIDVNEKENLLDQFTIDKDFDAVVADGEELMFNIKGSLNGKKIALSYDLTSGKVYYQKYMQKAGFKDTDPITMGSSEIQDKESVPFLTLPTLGDIIEKGKKMSVEGTYAELMEDAEDMTAYEDVLKDELTSSYHISEKIDDEVGKDAIKRNILEDMIVQNMMKISGRTLSAGQEITYSQYPTVYNFYNYLYRSFEYYSLKSMDQIDIMNTYVNEMLTIRENSTTSSPEELLRQAEINKNQERFVLHGIVNQKVMGFVNNEMRNQNPEYYLLSFFQGFEKEVGGMKVIDVEMMKDYFKTMERNTENDSVGKWQKNDVFNKLYAEIYQNISGEQADVDMNEQLKTV